MEGNSAGSDSPGRGRKAGLWALGALAVLLAAWGVSQYIEYLGKRTASRTDSAAAPADPSIPDHPISLNIDARVMDEGNREFPVGTPLPRRLMLTMANPDGQEYSMPFDKVGAWAVDAPAGEYSVALDQKHLGNWRWKLEGDGVRLDGGARAYRFKVTGRGKPLTVRLTLY